MKATLLMVVAIAATGCAPQFKGRQGPGDDGRELPPGMAASPAKEMALKVVSSKEAPNTLIASDRSVCRVSEQKYRETELGHRILCAWSKA